MSLIFQISALIAFGLNILLGLIVFGISRKRRVNQCFLITTIAVSIWLGCVILASFSDSNPSRLFWVRQSQFMGFLLPFTFDLLRLSIAHTDAGRRYYLGKLVVWVPIFLLAGVLSQSPSFVIEIESTAEGWRPLFGGGQIPYLALWLFALAVLVARYTKDLYTTQGIKRLEIQFILFAWVAAITIGLTLGNIAPMISGSDTLPQAMPLCVIALDSVLAYGIATRRIMDVNEILRRVVAYGLLLTYLVLLYFLVRAAATTVLSLFPAALPLVDLLATIIVALSLAPAHGRMQQFANKLFINRMAVDIQSALSQAREAILSIRTTDELLRRFAEIARDATGTDHIQILLLNDDDFVETYPLASDSTDPIRLHDSQLVKLLQEQQKPVCLDAERRQRPTPFRITIINEMVKLHAALAVGVQTKGELMTIVLLGRRLSGKPYSVHEQDALQLFCSQIVVAMENAELYTEVQNGKIYNEILLDSLVSGVIAVNSKKVVTVFNREAQRITGLPPASVLGKGPDSLPKAIAEVISESFTTDHSSWDRDLTITRNNEEEAPVRISTSTFRSHTGDRLGVLAVLNDLSIVKKLEEQVRRTDRLASLGTLSAGMAHEIKNPLVSIKTFTQLLPERYDDDEFRRTFSALIGQEVLRIDSIVNRLLHFARPAKACLVAMNIHDVLNDTLLLIDQQLRRSNIQLEKEFRAKTDRILGDADLLNQTFINFFLNAIEAMDPGGTLTVNTELVTSDGPRLAPRPSRSDSCITVTISDTGSGIAQEDLSHVFDPFFTTKMGGTGLGLSVSHGIIQEHDATVDVESNKGTGTSFHLTFPIHQTEKNTGAETP